MVMSRSFCLMERLRRARAFLTVFTFLLLHDLRQAQKFGTDPELLPLRGVYIDFNSNLVAFQFEVGHPALRGEARRFPHGQNSCRLEVSKDGSQIFQVGGTKEENVAVACLLDV